MNYLKNVFLKSFPNNNRIVLLGNTLEFFDLYLYIHFATVISQKFFPPGFEKSIFFQSFTFSQLYLLAPIACIVFSYMGDKYGRKPIIVHTGLAMAISSTLIIFLPTYEMCGEIATFLILMLRIVQGIALAGEPVAANLYLTENTSMDRDSPWHTQAPWYIELITVSQQLGGLIALFVAWVTWSVAKDNPNGWRIPFALCAVFVGGIFFIRKHLKESPEYLEATSNKTDMNIFERGERGYLYLRRTAHFYKKNILCWILLLLPYPIVFNLCFLKISPKIVGNAPLEDLLLHNFYVSAGTIFLGLFFACLPLKFKWELRKTVTSYVFIGLVFASIAVWGVENNKSWLLVYICQILMMSLVNFGLVMAGLLKVLPVIGRYSYMGLGWGIGRVINFFLVVLALELLKNSWGLYGCISLLYVVAALGLVGVWCHVSYYKLDDALTLKTLKESKKNGMVPGRAMTSEEIDEYIEKRKHYYNSLES